jgi:hypothetical protein
LSNGRTTLYDQFPATHYPSPMHPKDVPRTSGPCHLTILPLSYNLSLIRTDFTIFHAASTKRPTPSPTERDLQESAQQHQTVQGMSKLSPPLVLNSFLDSSGVQCKESDPFSKRFLTKCALNRPVDLGSETGLLVVFGARSEREPSRNPNQIPLLSSAFPSPLFPPLSIWLI